MYLHLTPPRLHRSLKHFTPGELRLVTAIVGLNTQVIVARGGQAEVALLEGVVEGGLQVRIVDQLDIVQVWAADAIDALLVPAELGQTVVRARADLNAVAIRLATRENQGASGTGTYAAHPTVIEGRWDVTYTPTSLSTGNPYRRFRVQLGSHELQVRAA